MQRKYDVIVVGAGLIGMLFARTASTLGVRVAVIDKKSPKEIIASADNGTVSYTHLTLPTICSV